MQTWRRGRRVGTLLLCCACFVLAGAKGRVEARARVLHIAVAQGMAERAADELRSTQASLSSDARVAVHVVDGCAFRLQWVDEGGDAPRRILQVESLGS